MSQVIKLKCADVVQEWKEVLIGCGILILGAYLRVPFYPIAFTMQMSALLIIGLTLSPRQAVRAVLVYLGLATLGLPVLGSQATNSLWLIGKSGGYLVAFPIAVYVVAYMKEKGASLLGVLIGYCIIYLLGFLWLIPFVGPLIAFQKGVLFFIPSGVLKTIIAYSIVNGFKSLFDSKENR